MGRWLSKLLPVCLLLGLISVWVSQPRIMQVLQLKTFDMYQQLWPRDIPEDFPVTIIDIDEKSLERLGQWPWPRTAMSALVERAFSQGVTAMGFDIVFAEPDRTSPEVAMKGWHLTAAEKKRLTELPRHDDIFMESLEGKRVVLGYTLDLSVNAPEIDDDFDIFSEPTGRNLDILPVPEVHAFVRNLHELEDAAPAMGWFGYIPDIDNIVRYLPMLVRHQDAVYAPLSIKLLRAYSQTDTLEPLVDARGIMTGMQFGNYRVPTGVDSRYYIHFRHHTRANFVSAVDVIHGKVDPQKLAGKMVLVGTSAEGLLDFRPTPLESKIPGVDMHAQVIENILDGRFLLRPGDLPLMEQAGTLLLGLLLIFAVHYFTAGASAWLALIMFMIPPTVGVAAFHKGYLVDALVPVGILLVLYAVQTALTYIQEERKRKEIRGAFSHYLSPEMVQLVSQNPEQLSLGGEEKELTVLFSDIRGFTTLSEGFSPEELTNFINDYLTPMTDIVMDQQGTIDKYMGDAIMAFWNAPLDVENHAAVACQAALDMLSRLDELNKEWQAQGLPEVRVGVGLHTGLVTVGNMGSSQRFDYTVMGDNVNLASRLEGLCKPYGTTTVVSEDIRIQVPQGTFLPLDKVIVKGKSEPVDVYELITLVEPTTEQLAEIKAVTQAIEAYREQNWDAAEKSLKDVKQHDQLVALYQERIDQYRQTPPAKDWNGAWERRSK